MLESYFCSIPWHKFNFLIRFYQISSDCQLNVAKKNQLTLFLDKFMTDMLSFESIQQSWPCFSELNEITRIYRGVKAINFVEKGLKTIKEQDMAWKYKPFETFLNLSKPVFVIIHIIFWIFFIKMIKLFTLNESFNW